MSRSDHETAVTSLYGTDATPSAQRRALMEGSVPVAVYGLGKLGLPVASVFAERTGNVTGVDVDPDVVEAIRAGECPVENEPGLPELVAELVADGALSATTDAAVVDASVHVLVVPTLLDEDDDPDLSVLVSALRDLARGLTPGDLVLVESTVPPGTSRWMAGPVLRASSGLADGEFGVAFCPERTQSGRALQDVRGAYPKVVGGTDDESGRAAALVYDELVDNEVVRVADATTAECVKLFEGVYRDVNIALANELARLADDLAVDVGEAIRVANTQPYCDIHSPGPGVGGHCIPYYPHFLTDAVDTDAPLIEQARATNDAMPTFTVQKLSELLEATGKSTAGARVAILGLTYRPGVPEVRKSPGVEVAHVLAGMGAEVCGVDPFADRIREAVSIPLVGPDRFEELARDLDAAVMVTPHREFEAFEWSRMPPMVVVDGRDALNLSDTDHVVYTIGDGGE
jgi:UDP-N-acetyl-D-mannosaminuronic acid dehydrogenase